MAYADIMAKVSRCGWIWTTGGVHHALQNTHFLSFTLPFFAQSCHIDEEEEGDEQNAEDEMSFEVRQSELVMGGQGQGTRNTVER